jgi:DNA mismatch repair ATPase MutS
MEAVRSRQKLIRVLFEMVGAVDALIAIASYRHSLAAYCVPTFDPPDKRLILEDALHPMLPEGVPNSLLVEGKGIFVTGSNMSGKTTFIRTVAVNAMLAQTIVTCTARRYAAPLLEVHTSIGRSDSLQEGKSYYMSEVEAIGSFLEDAAEAAPCLFVIDEIFRGTNTTERVAASKAVLDALNRADGPHIVLVSTHDIDLAYLLETAWDRYHFREYVEEGDLQFDFQLRPGLSSSRNALRLLAACDYPAAVVADAEATAARIDLESRRRIEAPTQP